MAKSEGIYSPALRTRTVGTYKAPSVGQHKAMLKAEGIKYKGLSNKDIVNLAKKIGQYKKQIPPSVWSKLKSEDVKKFITEPIKKKQSKLLRRSAILGAGAVGTGLLVDRAKQKKGGSVKTSKYNKGGGVRKSKYSL